MEIWKDIKGYEGLYLVSNYGRVKTLPRKVRSVVGNDGFKTIKEKIHKPCDNGNGYKYVTIRINGGKNTHRYIHRIVAESFLNNPKSLPQVNHKDGNKANNKVENLEWISRAGNMKHASEMGLCNPSKGEDNAHHKLTEFGVLDIRRECKNKTTTQKMLALKYGISEGYVSNIFRRVKWRHI